MKPIKDKIIGYFVKSFSEKKKQANQLFEGMIINKQSCKHVYYEHSLLHNKEYAKMVSHIHLSKSGRSDELFVLLRNI